MDTLKSDLEGTVSALLTERGIDAKALQEVHPDAYEYLVKNECLIGGTWSPMIAFDAQSGVVAVASHKSYYEKDNQGRATGCGGVGRCIHVVVKDRQGRSYSRDWVYRHQYDPCQDNPGNHFGDISIVGVEDATVTVRYRGLRTGRWGPEHKHTLQHSPYSTMY